MDIALKNYYSGTSGLLLPVPNKLHFPEEYQEKSRLSYYASLMNTIEINSSFYKIPLASTVKRWAGDVPDDFLFTFKLFRDITHHNNLAFDPDLLKKFMEVIAHAGDKKGCLLVQFPPGIRISHFRQLRTLFSVLRDNDPSAMWKIAVEFRHPSLYVEEVYELLAEYQFGMVIHDKKPAGSPLLETHKDFIYLRFHGPNGDYADSYTDEVLAEYASYVKVWLSKGKKVFVYFNNTMGEAIRNLNTLKDQVSNRSYTGTVRWE